MAILYGDKKSKCGHLKYCINIRRYLSWSQITLNDTAFAHGTAMHPYASKDKFNSHTSASEEPDTSQSPITVGHWSSSNFAALDSVDVHPIHLRDSVDQ